MSSYEREIKKIQIRGLTHKELSKRNICSSCGRVGYTEWHHPIYRVEKAVELCYVCHDGNERVQKKRDARRLLLSAVQ